ncbi:m-phase inducer phosphatase [Spiromyces aspiralis]|uniref:M-phase inducer phosphatase n=1 Tax=Spiromyces aspiralis TaxID=68401 RepID=A0ACC1HE35_9FUNG|nr:m-phase inducer phosphatase [Spiromyces aspiralis]
MSRNTESTPSATIQDSVPSLLSSPTSLGPVGPMAFSGYNPFCVDRIAPRKAAFKESRIPDHAPSASPIANIMGSTLLPHLAPDASSPILSAAAAPKFKTLDASLGSNTHRLFKRKFDLDSSIEDSSFGMMLQANSPSTHFVESMRRQRSLHQQRGSSRLPWATKSSGLAQMGDILMGDGNSSFASSTDDGETSSFEDSGSFLGAMGGYPHLSQQPLGHERTDGNCFNSSSSSHRRQKSLSLFFDDKFDAGSALTPVRPTISAPMKRARSQSSSTMGLRNICEDADDVAPSAELAAPAAADPVDSDPPSFTVGSPCSPECLVLPCHSAPTDTVKRIDAQTMSDVISGKYKNKYDEHLVVDCRFPYEYQGGHIKDAVNAPTIESLEKLLLEQPVTDKKTVVILHCEYSIQRAPTMASHLRRRDRELNAHRYPKLYYPEIYVLKGGYRNFFAHHKHQCYPQNYVEMNDSAFTEDCRQRMAHFNRQFKRAKSVNDASIRSFGCSPTSLMSGSGNNSSGNGPLRVAARLGRTRSMRPSSRTLPSLSLSLSSTVGSHSYPNLYHNNNQGNDGDRDSYLSSLRIFR